MNNSNLLLICTVISLLTMGAGCTVKSSGDQTGYDCDTTSSTEIASVASDNTLMPISIIISPSTETTNINSVSKTSPTKNYTTALNIYQNSGYYFQFSSCLGNPETLNIRSGEKFMIDNRDNKTHEIGIELKNYKLQAYDFAIISIEKNGTYSISCDGSSTVLLNIDA